MIRSCNFSFITKRGLFCYFILLLTLNCSLYSLSLPLYVIGYSIIETGLFFGLLGYAYKEIYYRSRNINVLSTIFIYALAIRLVYLIVICIFNMLHTDTLLGLSIYSDGRAYDEVAQKGAYIIKHGGTLISELKSVFGWDNSDIGYPIYMSIIYALTNNSIIVLYLLKALINSFTCVLIFKIAYRNFGPRVACMSAAIAIIMPSFWFYCGINMKEVEMLFLITLFLERTDYILKSGKASFIYWVIPITSLLLLFLFRTVLVFALFYSLIMSLLFGVNKLDKSLRTIILTFTFLLIVVSGSVYAEDALATWEARSIRQKATFEYVATKEGGNKLLKHVSGSALIPAIIMIPLPSMLTYGDPKKEEMELRNGEYYIKTFLAFFVYMALYFIYKKKQIKNLILLLSFMISYLIIVGLSGVVYVERFHFPIFSCFIIFVAYGMAKMRKRYVRFYHTYLILIFFMILGWNLFKLMGRGML